MIKLLPVLLCCGCSLTAALPEPLSVEGLDPATVEPLPDRCVDLDTAHMVVSALSTTFTGIGAATNGVLAIWPEPDRDVVIGVGVTGLAAGVIGGTLNVVDGMIVQRFVSECGGTP